MTIISIYFTEDEEGILTRYIAVRLLNTNSQETIFSTGNPSEDWNSAITQYLNEVGEVKDSLVFSSSVDRFLIISDYNLNYSGYLVPKISPEDQKSENLAELRWLNYLGVQVRMVWVQYIKELEASGESVKEEHLLPYAQLEEKWREVDRRIGKTLYNLGYQEAREKYEF